MGLTAVVIPDVERKNLARKARCLAAVIQHEGDWLALVRRGFRPFSLVAIWNHEFIDFSSRGRFGLSTRCTASYWHVHAGTLLL